MIRQALVLIAFIVNACAPLQRFDADLLPQGEQEAEELKLYVYVIFPNPESREHSQEIKAVTEGFACLFRADNSDNAASEEKNKTKPEERIGIIYYPIDSKIYTKHRDGSIEIVEKSDFLEKLRSRNETINFVDSLLNNYDTTFASKAKSHFGLDAGGVYLVGVAEKPLSTIIMDRDEEYDLIDLATAEEADFSWEDKGLKYDFRGEDRTVVLHIMQEIKEAALDGRAPEFETPSATMVWFANKLISIGRVARELLGDREAIAAEEQLCG